MDNRLKYHFDDFTYEAYENLLSLAKSKYVFRTYTNFNKQENFILWRHDVDFSIHNAYDIAEIEHKNGIASTFFIHLHSNFYNVLEKEVYELIKGIISLDHEIGLHFDTHFYDIRSEEQLDQYIVREKEMLESLFNKKIEVFSFHNTNPFIMSCKKPAYGGLINTYSAYFQEEIGYCSDSYGVWRFRRLLSVLETGEDVRLQVLTHPELWSKLVKSPIERVYRCIEGRAEKVKSWYVEFLKTNNRDVIDW